MNSPGTRSSPSFRNVKNKQKQSPIEIKEKLRKSYKEKIHNCRSLIFNSLRGNLSEYSLQNTLNDIYKAMFNFNEESASEEEEQLLEEIKNDLVQEELNWWTEEYEKFHDNIDWSAIDTDEVICPICQKVNICLTKINTISCSICNIHIKTEKTLAEIKKNILDSIEVHNSACSREAQFTCVSESDDTHIYLICDTCSDMQAIF